MEGLVLQMPGRSERFSEPPVAGLAQLISEAAGAIQPFLDRPFVFFGHSFGTLVSFELARHLRRHNLPRPARLIVAGHLAPQILDREPPLHGLPDDRFITELSVLGGIPDGVLAHRELLDLLLPALRADILLNEVYVYHSEPPLPCPITALGGTRDVRVPVAHLEAWRDQTSSSFELFMMEGGHFFLDAHLESVIRLIAARSIPRT